MRIVFDANEYIFSFGFYRKQPCERLIEKIPSIIKFGRVLLVRVREYNSLTTLLREGIPASLAGTPLGGITTPVGRDL